MINSEAIQVTLTVTSVLDELELPYVIGGSMASIVHGMLRTTMGVDIIADLEPGQVEAFTAEDVVLAKLDWFRLGGELSERQWRDVLTVLKTQQTALDLAYMHRWAETLQVTDLLEQAVEEAGKEDNR
jgi:hypothetical protein